MHTSFSLLLVGLLFVQAVYSLSEAGCKRYNDNGECKKGAMGNSTSSILGTIMKDVQAITTRDTVMGNGTSCPAMSVIFARGTFEPGNVGILTGPPFFDAIADYMNGTGQLSVQGVEYPADVAGFLAGGSRVGAEKMASLLNSTLTSCPSTLITLSGYSQGSQLVHLATSSLPPATLSHISSIVLFGDPKNGTAINGVDSSKVLTVCHSGDNICEGGKQIKKEHLTYGSEDAERAAMFVLGGVAGLGISSGSVRMTEGGELR